MVPLPVRAARHALAWRAGPRARLVAGALLLGVGLAASRPGLALAQAQGGFSRERLALQAELESVLPYDLDGDGRQDLVLLESDRGVARDVPFTLRVMLQTGEGFRTLEGATAQLPFHVSLAQVAAFRGGPALAMLLPGEVVLWPWRGGRFASEAAVRQTVQSLFPVPSGELQRGLTWLHDLDGDGVSEVLVPRFDGVEVLAQDAVGRLRRRAVLRLHARTQMLDWYRRNLLAFELPALSVQQVDQQGWLDVVLFLDGQLWVFLLEPGMDGGERLPGYYRDLQPPRRFDPAEPWDPPIRLVSVEDLNGDGLFDLILSKNAASDSQFNTRTHVLLFYGQAGQGGAPIDLAAEPDQVYISEGFSLPLILDVDGDGLRDLVLVDVEIGFWNVIKALIQRSVNAQAAIYRMPARGGRFPRDPQHLRSYEVTFSLGRFAHQPIAAFGDLNGDGLADLLLSVSKDVMGIHWGRRGEVWPSEPNAQLEDFMPIRDARMRVGDLDGDGRDDLIFAYNRDDIRQMPEMNRKLTVLRSRYGSPRSTAQAGRP